MQLKVGDPVTISPSSEFAWQAELMGTGIITKITSSNILQYQVQSLDKTYQNSYAEKDLIKNLQLRSNEQWVKKTATIIPHGQ